MISMISIRGWNMLEKHGLEDGINGTNSVMFHHGK